MQKPKCCRTLAGISVILLGIQIFLNIYITVFPEFFMSLLQYRLDSEMPLFITLMLIGEDMLYLPLAALSAWNYFSSSAKGILTAVLAPILIVISSLGSIVIQRVIFLMCGSAEIIAQVNVMRIAKSFPSVLGRAAFVLLCCGAAIECYAKSTQSLRKEESL